MPEISVIVPVYKVEPYIRHCVDSILNQTFNDFELILIDDGSPDTCGAICDEYEKNDNRITVIHQKNMGLSAARNAGIDWSVKNSNSEWITFIDSDDWVELDYLEKLYNSVIQSKQSVSVCALIEEAEYHTPKTDFLALKYETVNTEDLWCNKRANSVVACGKLFYKSLFDNIRFPVGKIHEDEHTTHKLIFKSNKITYIKEPLYHYFCNPNSITNVKWSPKKLSAVEAQKSQIGYFSAKELKKAEKSTYESLLNLLRIYIDCCKKDKSNAKYVFPMFFTLKIYGFKYYFNTHSDIDENEWFYAKAFPIFIKIRGILEKFFKKGNL